MSKTPKRKFYFKPLIDLDVAYNKRHAMMQQRDVLRDCGLEREAGVVEGKIREQNQVIDRLKDAVMDANRQLKRHMLLCFSAGDIATTIADRMAEVFDELTAGIDKQGGNDLAELFRRQADAWNQCVQMIDGDGEHGNERVSMYYAEIAEEICEAVIPQILAIIDRHMASERGKRLL